MTNLFDAAAAPKMEPEQIVQGALVQWTRPDYTASYPPAQYNLIFTALSADGSAKFSVTSAAGSTGDHAFAIPSATSAGFTPGTYHYQVEIERLADQERVFAYRGKIVVTANYAASNSDPRSHAQIMLAKIESILEGRADKDVSSYSINGRSITKMTIAELLDLRGTYRNQVRLEEQQDAIKQGRRGKSTIKVRFV